MIGAWIFTIVIHNNMQIGVTDIGGGGEAGRERKAIEKDHERMGSQRIYIYIRPLIFFCERRCYFKLDGHIVRPFFFMRSRFAEFGQLWPKKKNYIKCADPVGKKRKFAAVGGKKKDKEWKNKKKKM